MRRRIISLIALTVASLALASPASAQPTVGVVTASGTLRAGPGSDYPSVDSASRGDELEIYGCTRGYSWCDVRLEDSRGWFPGSRIAFVRNGRDVLLPSIAGSLGVTILTFGFEDYWGSHYRERPFYREQRWWGRNGIPYRPDYGHREPRRDFPPNRFIDRPAYDHRDRPTYRPRDVQPEYRPRYVSPQPDRYQPRQPDRRLPDRNLNNNTPTRLEPVTPRGQDHVRPNPNPIPRNTTPPTRLDRVIPENKDQPR